MNNETNATLPRDENGDVDYDWMLKLVVTRYGSSVFSRLQKEFQSSADFAEHESDVANCEYDNFLASVAHNAQVKINERTEREMTRA